MGVLVRAGIPTMLLMDSLETLQRPHLLAGCLPNDNETGSENFMRNLPRRVRLHPFLVRLKSVLCFDRQKSVKQFAHTKQIQFCEISS